MTLLGYAAFVALKEALFYFFRLEIKSVMPFASPFSKASTTRDLGTRGYKRLPSAPGFRGGLSIVD